MCICDRDVGSVVNWIQCHTWSMFYANSFGLGINRMLIRNYTIDRSALLFVLLYSRTKEPFLSAFDSSGERKSCSIFACHLLTTAVRACDQVYICALTLQAIFMVHYPGSCDAHIHSKQQFLDQFDPKPVFNSVGTHIGLDTPAPKMANYYYYYLIYTYTHPAARENCYQGSNVICINEICCNE